MNVTAWHNGGTVFGIRIGPANREKHFNHLRGTGQNGRIPIEIVIDGQAHHFELTSGFWDDCPEIRDCGEPILRGWWEREYGLPWPLHRPHAARLVALDGRRFRLSRLHGDAAE